MIVRVEVTAADIANGTRRMASFCPVAIAIRRATGSDRFVDVSRKRIAVEHVGCVPPAAVAAFVEAFDNGHRVEPFAFELELAP